jgi:hypothetical protein
MNDPFDKETIFCERGNRLRRTRFFNAVRPHTAADCDVSAKKIAAGASNPTR